MSELEFINPSQSIDRSSILSRIAELRHVDEFSEIRTDEEKVLNSITNELENKINWIFSETSLNLSALHHEDLNEIASQLKKELSELESENAGVQCETEELERNFLEDYEKLEKELERLCCSLEFIGSQGSAKTKEDMQLKVSLDDLADSSAEPDSKFKELELSHQIEKNKTTLKSLQELDSIFKRFETVEKMENALTGIRVIEIEGSRIRLSLKTCVPFFESVLHHQDLENVIEPLEMNHEMIIETEDETWELRNVEIFPSDTYIGDIIDPAKSFRQLYPTLSVLQSRSYLEWFVRRVQDRIALSSLRRYLVKSADKSRHSFEYLNKDDMIIAHVVGGVKAFIKLPQGWPLLNLPLELMSLKCTSQHTKEMSLSFLCKIVEMANLSDINIRQNLSSFADVIEGILMQQMHTQQNMSNTDSTV